jgi:hypothetical protein
LIELFLPALLESLHPTTISRTASASHSSGTSRPSLNWSGSSTSNRRHLLLIACLALYDKWNVRLRQRLQRRLRHQMLAPLKHATGKAAQQKAKRLSFSRAILKLNPNHESAILTSDPMWVY